MSVVELPAMPPAGPLYRRAALSLVPGLGAARRVGELPDVGLTVRGVPVDRDHLAVYNRVCGFRLGDVLPATYPHVLAFPLALRLMTAPDFPFPLVGLVHLANRITLRRPIDAGERLDLTVSAADLRPHPRGRQVDVIATATVDDAEVWRDVSTYLSRERTADGGERRDRGDRPTPPAASAQWRVEPRIGPAYAKVSGDHNPIHISRLGARLLGFSRPIAHGMWSKARCLAALEGRLPEAYSVDVSFKVPLPLPSIVAFSASRSRDAARASTTPADAAQASTGQGGAGWWFALHNARSGKPHLTGTAG